MDIQLGTGFHTNQQSEVMAAVQAMRAKAHAAGNLKSSSQITVVQETPSTIVIKPANPDVILCSAIQSNTGLRHTLCRNLCTLRPLR